MDWKNERMGAGYVTGTGQEVETSFCPCVVGPLSTLRAEAASLRQLLIDFCGRSSTPLLLSCAARPPAAMGTSELPSATDVVHFDVIFPLLDELRRWSGPILLVKVKSHTGCLLNERADE